MAVLPAPPLSVPIVQTLEGVSEWDDYRRAQVGKATTEWLRWFETLKQQVTIITQVTQAQAPTTLGLSDAGALYYITDFAHYVRWNGSAYEFMGDPSGQLADFAVAPGLGWALCDGSATTYLAVGTTLTAVSITLPNLSGSPAYKKSGATYTGSILAAVAPGLSGSTADATATISGNTAANADTLDTNVAGGATTLAIGGHLHGKGTLAVDAHQHAKGTLAVDAAGEPARLVVLPYFRR